jgi:hypothetical protein
MLRPHWMILDIGWLSRLMKTVFDVVDLLQLQEIWVRSPIAQAYARLERRQSAYPCPMEFRLMWLMPRLGQLRNSPAWQTNQLEKRSDPAQVPLCAMTDAYLEVLFPEGVAAAQTRQRLFLSVYNHFVVSQFQGDSGETCGLLRALSDVRAPGSNDYLNQANQPLEGSSFWIPVDLTDEIRALDSRYQGDRADTPATYVINETFWPLLVKSTAQDIQAAAARYVHDSKLPDTDVHEAHSQRQLWRLVELAHDWNRSSSVVGLYYQVEDGDERLTL